MMAFNGCEVKHLAISASYHGLNYRVYRTLSLLPTSAVSAHVLTVTPQEVWASLLQGEYIDNSSESLGARRATCSNHARMM